MSTEYTFHAKSRLVQTRNRENNLQTCEIESHILYHRLNKLNVSEKDTSLRVKKKVLFLLRPKLLLRCHVTHSRATHQQLCTTVCAHTRLSYTHRCVICMYTCVQVHGHTPKHTHKCRRTQTGAHSSWSCQRGGSYKTSQRSGRPNGN